MGNWEVEEDDTLNVANDGEEVRRLIHLILYLKRQKKGNLFIASYVTVFFSKLMKFSDLLWLTIQETQESCQKLTLDFSSSCPSFTLLLCPKVSFHFS